MSSNPGSSPYQTQSAVASPEPTPLPAGPVQRTGLDLWSHRIVMLLFVLLCAGTGVLLVFLPWNLQWTDNYLLMRYPALRPFITNGFTRGICSGLGILDLWIGFSEAIHYHEEEPASN